MVSSYVNNYLADYQQNRSTQWSKKCSLLNLLITASISSYTYRNGASDINIPADTLFSYIEQLVIPELQEQDIDNLQLLKATCIKFVYMFRNQIPEQHTQTFLGLFSGFLGSSSVVNQSYAAACIEKLILKKNATGQPVLTSDNIDGNILMGLLSNLCNLLNDQKNLYAMRSLYRVVQLSKDKVLQFSQ